MMLALEAACNIQGLTSMEVVNSNRKPYRLNESKYL
jgi:hypothetical protein